MDEYQDWIGKSVSVSDEITAAPLDALSATLDRDDTPAKHGTAVPPMWHLLYFVPKYRPGEMRHDGHAASGELTPPIKLPRRMWAGSRFEWINANPLRVGDAVKRISRIASITPKTGKSGDLVFLKTVHEFHNDSGLSFVNEHTSVYRGESKSSGSAAPSTTASATLPQPVWQRELTPDEILLFRYSALTFNAHRIHYDWKYATEKEGYPTILVQGPLIATLLLDLLRRQKPDAAVRSLEFKAVRPSFAGRILKLNGRQDGHEVSLWSQDDEGRLAMSANAELEH
jgi:3-methylfumaryl-CoA hydratase